MKKVVDKLFVGLLIVLLLVSPAVAAGISDDVVKIGAIVDMSGIYAKHGGPGAVLAAEMAVKDFGGKVLGKPIKVVSADYRSQADVASAKGREWIDVDKVDAIFESTNSSAAIALQRLGGEKHRITFSIGSASTALTNSECTPYSIHYAYDTYSLAAGTANAIVKSGGKKWTFLTADYAFGHSLEENTSKVVKSLGGEVVSTIRHPMGTTDFSSFLLQAQESGADIIGLANAGVDTTTALTQAKEFGVGQGGKQSFAALLIFLNDIKSLGLEIGQGMKFTTGFYWDYNDETRAFSERFYKLQGAMPSMVQAGFYSAVTNYLKAIEAVGTDDPDKVMAYLKSTTINDFFAKGGKIRPDGRMVHDMYLAEVKKPSESKSEWDLVKIIKTIPGDEAYMPLSESTCKYVH